MKIMKDYKGDKRSKEYRQWKKNHKQASDGVGDSVSKVLKKTGITKAVEWLLGNDCNCDNRKKILNKLYPYHKPKCLTELEYNYLSSKIGKLNKVTPAVQSELLKIYNRVFNDRASTTSCSSCFLNGVWKKLETVYKEYK